MMPAQPLQLLGLAFLLLSYASQPGPASSAETRELILAVYSVPKEAFEKRLIPAFQRQWRERTGQEVRIRSSYGASGAQARAVIGGFEADVAVLSVEGDLDQIARAGLLTHDWRKAPHRGMISTSIVAFGVRKGNPKGIKTWEDLARPGIEVLYPNPKTSGGAMWDIIAMYGAALKLATQKQGSASSAGTTPTSGAAVEPLAMDLIKRVQKNVKVMDKSGRESVTTFERGVGDVIVTYENELLPRIKSGRPYDLVLPPETVLIENPAAVIDRNVDRHRTRDVAEAFLAFLHSDEAQQAFVEYGFRPVTAPPPPNAFTIGDLGGWEKVAERLFGSQGIWTRVVEELARGR